MSPFIRRSSVRHPDRRLARSVFFLLLAIYTATFAGLPDNPDGEIAFQTTSSLARRGRLALGGTPEAELILDYASDAPEGAIAVRRGAGSRSERSYAWFGVGYTIGAVPFYLAGKVLDLVLPDLEPESIDGRPISEYYAHAFVGWRNSLLTALTAMVLVLAARRLGVSRGNAWIAGMTYGLTSFAWPQARSCLSDVQATFFLFVAFHLVLQLRERFDRLEKPGYRTPFWIGLAVGCAFLTRVSTLPAGLVLIGLGEAILRGGHKRLATSRHHADLISGVGRLRVVAALLAPFALCVVVFLVLNQWRFGDPLDSGYGVVRAGMFGYPVTWGLAGLLLSPGRGLLWMAPPVLLLPFGILQGRERGDRPWFLSVAAVAIAVILPASLLVGWHGAWTYGPRYILPALPFLWIGFAMALEWATEHRRRAYAGLALAFLGFVIQLPAVLVDHMTHQDLAVHAAPIAWPGEPGEPEADLEEARFTNIQWDWRFAAPWAHWRILRHRTASTTAYATTAESFGVRQLFFLDDDTVLEPSWDRSRGFRHLFWIDAAERGRVPIWIPFVLVGVLLATGVVLASRGLQRTSE